MDSEIIEKSLPVVILKSITYVVFILAAFLGNACILHVTRKERSLRTIPNLYIASLALADLIFSVTCIPALLIKTLAHNMEWILGDFMCQVIGVLNYQLAVVSMWTLVAIGVNRCLAVTSPLSVRHGRYSKQMQSVKFNVGVIVAIWVVVFAFSVPPAFQRGLIAAMRNTCYIDGENKKAKIYVYIYLNVFFIFPAITLVTLYVVIYRTMRRINRKKRSRSKISLQGTSENLSKDTLQSDVSTIRHGDPSLCNGQVGPQNAKSSKKSSTQEIKTTKLMFSVLVTFFVCWTPFIVASILYAFRLEPKEFGFMTFATFTVSFNSVVNPFVYAAYGNAYKKALLKLLRCA